MLQAGGQSTSFLRMKVCIVGAVLSLLCPATAYSILPLHRTPLLAPDNHNEIFFNIGHPLQGTPALGSSFSSTNKGDDLPDARRAARLALELQRLETFNKEEHDNYIAAGYKEGASGVSLGPLSSLQHLGPAPTLASSLPDTHPHELLSSDIGDTFTSVHHEVDAGFDLHGGGGGIIAHNGWP